MAQAQEFRRLAGGELVARARQVHRFLDADAARMRQQPHHAIAQIDRLLQVVRHEEHGRAGGGDDGEHLILQGLAGHRIQRAERLVHQQHGGVLCQAAGDLQTLLHAAGQLVREALLLALQPYLGQQFADPVGALGFRHTERFERERDIAEGVAPRQQGLAIILEHDRHVLARLGHGLALVGDSAAGGFHQPGDQAQRGGFAAARGANHAEEFALADRHVDAAQDFVPADGEPDIVELDQLGAVRLGNHARRARHNRTHWPESALCCLPAALHGGRPEALAIRILLERLLLVADYMRLRPMDRPARNPVSTNGAHGPPVGQAHTVFFAGNCAGYPARNRIREPT